MNINETCELNGHYPSDEARLAEITPRVRRIQKSRASLDDEVRALRARNRHQRETMQQMSDKIAFLEARLLDADQPVVVQVVRSRPRRANKSTFDGDL